MTQQDTSSILRALPSVDALLRTETARALANLVGPQHLTSLARRVTDEMRNLLQQRPPGEESGNGGYSRDALLAEAALRLEQACKQGADLGLRRVINASGVILHTNLGRAPLSEAARRAISIEAARYCTLEYETDTGKRGRRGARVDKLLAELTGAEDALVVNNCAAAVLLVLTVIAKGGETLISRGELVEIGGDFRIPDVMRESGTRLVEVGATNRTSLSDYENALTDMTCLIMRVHPSNYRIVGFTAAPTLSELAELTRSEGIPLYEDAGSGALVDLSEYGLRDEPVIRESIAAGADLVSFSGDKLLGSSQAGIIVGRKELIEQLRRAPLYRALRADKLALAALEATLDAYVRETFIDEIPALRMLSYTNAEIGERASNFLDRLKQKEAHGSITYELIKGQSAIGGGSAPTTHPETMLVALKHESLSADELDQLLRRATPPVIARIAEDRILLDLRTVFPDEEEELMEVLLSCQNRLRF
jgi:L-seryl-tRNA(Ser) seleniumtransferase